MVDVPIGVTLVPAVQGEKVVKSSGIDGAAWPDGTIPIWESTGDMAASPFIEEAGNVRCLENLTLPRRVLLGQSTEIQAVGEFFILDDPTTPNQFATFPFEVVSNTTGGTQTIKYRFGAVLSNVVQSDDSVAIGNTFSLVAAAGELGGGGALVQSYTLRFQDDITNLTAKIRRGTVDGPIIFETDFLTDALAGQDTVFAAPGRRFGFLAGVTYFAEITSPDGTPVVLGEAGGDPYLARTFQAFQAVLMPASDEVDAQIDARATGTYLRDRLAALTDDARLPASSVRGIEALTGSGQHFASIRFDDADSSLIFTRQDGEVVTVNIGAQSGPPAFREPAVTALRVPSLESRIDTSVDLTGDFNITFHVSSESNIGTLELQINTVPVGSVLPIAADGSVSATVTISAQEWSDIQLFDATNLAFQLVGLDTNTPNGAVTSNTINVERRDLGPEEFIYWQTNPTDNSATVDVSTITAVEAVGTYDFNISTALNAAELLILLAPENRDVSAITEVTFGVGSLSRFTRTAGVRTLGAGSQAFASYVLTNNGPTGNVSFRVQGGP